MSKIEDALEKANQLRQNKLNNNMGQEPAPPPPLGPSKGKRLRQYSIGIFLALVVGLGVYRYAKEVSIPSRPKPPASDPSGNPRPAAQHPAPAKSSPQNNRLPTSIPLNSPDTVYASANPGWQRYITNSLEFRVLRKENAVKAIQVLSRQENVITADFFTSFLGETVGKDLFNVKSGEIKDGYYIERGAAGDTANVVVYRKKPAGEIMAFVVAYL